MRLVKSHRLVTCDRRRVLGQAGRQEGIRYLAALNVRLRAMEVAAMGVKVPELDFDGLGMPFAYKPDPKTKEPENASKTKKTNGKGAGPGLGRSQ